MRKHIKISKAKKILLREYCRSELDAWSWKPSQWHSGSFVLPLYALPPSTGNHDIILVLSLCNIFIFSRAQWKMWPTSHIHRISSDISTRVDEFSFKQVWCCDKSKIKELLYKIVFLLSFWGHKKSFLSKSWLFPETFMINILNILFGKCKIFHI